MKIGTKLRSALALLVGLLTSALLGANPSQSSTNASSGEGDFVLRGAIERSDAAVGARFSLRGAVDRPPHSRGSTFSVGSSPGRAAHGSNCFCDALFADDFETSDTSRWSSTVP